MSATSPLLESLLAACKDDPLSDDPRLVLADYLEESGDAERAEFVRLQLRAGEGEAGWRPERSAESAREMRLLRRHAGAWLGAEPHGCGECAYGAGLLYVDCRRGLVRLQVQATQGERAASEIPDRVRPW